MKFKVAIVYSLPAAAILVVGIVFYVDSRGRPAATLSGSGTILRDGEDIVGPATVQLRDGTKVDLGSESSARVFLGRHGTTSALLLARGRAAFDVPAGKVFKLITPLTDAVSTEGSFDVRLRGKPRSELFGRFVRGVQPYAFRAPLPMRGVPPEEVIVDSALHARRGTLSVATVYSDRSLQASEIVFVGYRRVMETEGKDWEKQSRELESQRAELLRNQRDLQRELAALKTRTGAAPEVQEGEAQPLGRNMRAALIATEHKLSEEERDLDALQWRLTARRDLLGQQEPEKSR